MMESPPLQQELVEQALADFAIPGLALAVVKDDAVVFARGYGVRELDAQAPVDEHTLFAVGSISKSFTATCLAMLVDAGQLNWDDRVIDHLPTFQLADAYVTREITVRDLLVHRSGLASVSGGTLWYGSTYDRCEVVRRLRWLQPVSSFRSQYAYQNVTYLVAGQIIEAVSGHSWDTFVRDRIFQPLHMTTSNTSVGPLAQASNVAIPHARVRGTVQPVAYRNYDNVGPAASINSSVVDMTQYVRLFLGGGVYAGEQLFSPTQARELWTAQTVVPIQPPTPSVAALAPRFMAYSLGWFVRDYHGHKLVTHSGGVDGMTALVTMLPDLQLGIVVLTNQEEALVSPMTYQLLDSYLGRPHTNWLPAYLELRKERIAKADAAEAQRKATRITSTTPALALEGYAGTYLDQLYGTATVTCEDAGLLLRFDATPAFTGDLEHWHYNTFQITWRDPVVPQGLVTFPLNADGVVAELQFAQPKLLDVDFSELHFKRMPEPALRQERSSS